MFHKVFDENFNSCLVPTERCIRDRMLHERMAQCLKISLDDLQRKTDLSKIRLNGAGVEVITIKK